MKPAGSWQLSASDQDLRNSVFYRSWQTILHFRTAVKSIKLQDILKMMTLQKSDSYFIKIWSKQFTELIRYQIICAASQQFRNNSDMQCSAALKKIKTNRVISLVQQKHSVKLPYHDCFITKNFHHAQKEYVLNRNLTLKNKNRLG